MKSLVVSCAPVRLKWTMNELSLVLLALVVPTSRPQCGREVGVRGP